MHSPNRQAALINAIRASLPQAWALYAYGSVARGEATASSDLDLAVLLPPGERLPDRLSLVAELSRIAGREVDIADLRTANLDLIHEVLRDGVQLFASARADVLAWEAERMTDYAFFNPRRKAILDRYLQEPLRAAS